MRKGFTLIEMMIVVAIIAIIAAIAIPSLLAARRSSLETNACGSMRAYCSAQTMFHRNDWDADGIMEYAPTVIELNNTADGAGQPINLVSAAFGNATAPATSMQGYYYTPMGQIAGNAVDWVNDYALCGAAAAYARTGYRTFIVSTEGTVFGIDAGGATGQPQPPVADYPADPQAAGYTIIE